MIFKILNIIDKDNGTAIVEIDANIELKTFVRNHYKRKRCTNKLLSRFLNEGLTNYIKR